nr:hypothetical protein [Granulicella tundricola]
MDVVGHDDEGVEFVFGFGAVVLEGFEEEFGVGGAVEEAAAVESVGCDEEGAFGGGSGGDGRAGSLLCGESVLEGKAGGLEAVSGNGSLGRGEGGRGSSPSAWLVHLTGYAPVNASVYKEIMGLGDFFRSMGSIPTKAGTSKPRTTMPKETLHKFCVRGLMD